MVVLTKERGKITAFARGTGNRMAVFWRRRTRFVLVNFLLYEGRNAYTMVQADVKNYFRELAEDFEGAYYGFYFMEFADYYAREKM